MRFLLQRVSRDFHGFSQHFSHRFHWQAGHHPGEVLRRQHLSQRAHLAVRTDGDHVIDHAFRLAVVLERACTCIGSDARLRSFSHVAGVPDFLWLAKTRAHISFCGKAFFQLGDAL